MVLEKLGPLRCKKLWMVEKTHAHPYKKDNN